MYDEGGSHDDKEVALGQIVLDGVEKAPRKILTEENYVRFGQRVASVAIWKLFFYHLSTKGQEMARSGNGSNDTD